MLQNDACTYIYMKRVTMCFRYWYWKCYYVNFECYIQCATRS
jgi:hypothetical protein